MKRYTPDLDMRSIPDDVLRSEVARRNALRRHSYTGGVVWAHHNPDTKRCRCKRCIAKRAAAQKGGV